MGEGMAIGIDGMRRGTVVGSRMAGLAGAVEEIRLPCSHFVVGYPAARLLRILLEKASSLQEWKHKRKKPEDKRDCDNSVKRYTPERRGRSILIHPPGR